MPGVDEGGVAALDVVRTSRGRETVEFDEESKQVRLPTRDNIPLSGYAPFWISGLSTFQDPRTLPIS
jgi:hypothetical protein